MKPVLQALVLAERIYTDAATQKKVICGTFNGLLIGRVPIPTMQLPGGSTMQMLPGGTDMGCPAAYISITDVVDGTELILQFVNQSKNTVLFWAGLKLEVKDRLATVEIVTPLPPMSAVVREPGIYTFDVLCDAEILGSHRLIVKGMGDQS